jgi:ABC-type multidrug transport system fused ATPase/permease subunit
MLAEFAVGQVLWSMFWFFMFFLWIMLLFYVFADIFRDHTLGGWGKALWVIFIIVLPYLGVFVYLIARGSSMQKRSIEQQQRQQEQFQAYVKEAAGSTGSPAEELARLADLKEKGVIDDAEFATLKAKALGGSTPAAS